MADIRGIEQSLALRILKTLGRYVLTCVIPAIPITDFLEDRSAVSISPISSFRRSRSAVSFRIDHL
jgi:hypothetical protein